MKDRGAGSERSADFVHSPFRYNGHQTYALGSIISLIPEHQFFIEPFCGGGGVFFAKPLAGSSWLNDVNRELIEAYNLIRDSPGRLIEFLRKERLSAERYDYFHKEFVPKDRAEVALRWFYLNRTSCFETMDRKWERDPAIGLDCDRLGEIISGCSRKLRGVRLTCGDFSLPVDKAPDNSFLFIAPPYSLNHSQTRTQSYRHPFGREDHARLARALKQNAGRVKFLLTYSDCREIRELYSWGDNVVEELKCDNHFTDDPTKRPEDQVRKKGGREEIAIMNYRRN